jgi:hypothetical protein
MKPEASAAGGGFFLCLLKKKTLPKKHIKRQKDKDKTKQSIKNDKLSHFFDKKA